MSSKLQLTRGGIRCRALERTEHVSAYTIDTTHSVNQAEDGRHINQDFAKPGVLGEMDVRWPGRVFNQVVMDYFYTPSPWHAER